MQNCRQSARYEVSISDEMRALVRRRRTAPETGVSSVDVTGPPPVRRFALRRDGQRPMILDGSEVLRISVVGAGLADAREGVAGGQQVLTIVCAASGHCVAQLTLIPPAGLPARPVYRTVPVQSASDVMALLTAVRPDLVLLTPELSDAHAPAKATLTAQCEDLTRAVAPLLKNAA